MSSTLHAQDGALKRKSTAPHTKSIADHRHLGPAGRNVFAHLQPVSTIRRIVSRYDEPRRDCCSTPLPLRHTLITSQAKRYLSPLTSESSSLPKQAATNRTANHQNRLSAPLEHAGLDAPHISLGASHHYSMPPLAESLIRPTQECASLLVTWYQFKERCPSAHAAIG